MKREDRSQVPAGLPRAYLTEMNYQGQRAADVRLSIRKLSVALSGQEDFDRLTLGHLQNADRRFAEWLGSQNFTQGTASQHRSRVERFLSWGMMKYPSLKRILDARVGAVEYLLNKAKEVRPVWTHVLRRFFLAAEALESHEALADHGPDICEAVFEELKGDVKGWKPAYNRLCKALTYLQEEGDLPPFEIPSKSYQIKGMVIHYGDPRFSNPAVAQALSTYDKMASDASLSAVVWPHPVTADSTRKRTIEAVEHYLSQLASHIENLETMSPEQVFESAKMMRYVADELEVRRLAPLTVEGRIQCLQSFAKRMFGIERVPMLEFFNAEDLEPRRDKQQRATSLDDHFRLIKTVNSRAKSHPHKQARLRLELLEMVMYLNAWIPVRKGNLLGIRLDSHLVRDTPTGIWEIHFPGKETKGGEPLVYEVSDELQARLALYIRTTRRKILKSKPSPYLFPTSTGHRNNGSTLFVHLKDIDQQFRDVTRMNAKSFHIIRDIITETCISRLSNGVFIASKVLGHKSPKTTVEAYFGTHGRSQLIVETRDVTRILEKGCLAQDDYQILASLVAQNPDNLRRFRKAIESLSASKLRSTPAM